MRTCVVIGGVGFVGQRLVQRLLEAEEAGSPAWGCVRAVDMGPAFPVTPDTPPVLADALETGRLAYAKADVRELPQMIEVCRGASVAFLLASPSPELDDFRLHYSVSVLGARNVVEACVATSVQTLVYTSSASIVFDGNHDLKGVDETYPYASKHMNVYGETKAQAEAIILAADGISTASGGHLRTCALRPSNVFGPGEKVMVTALARNAARGRLGTIIGDGKNLCDWTYVDNVVAAHVAAERALHGVTGDASAPDVPAGKAYFVTNDESITFWDFIFSLARALGYNITPRSKLPVAVALPLAQAVQAVLGLLNKAGLKVQFDFTPIRIKIMSHWRKFSCARAKNLLGYRPEVSIQEGIRRTASANLQLQRPAMEAAYVQRLQASKVHAALGGGKVADLLLWRDRRSSALLLVALLLLFWMVGRAGSPLTFVATLSLYTMVLLFAYHHLQTAAARYTRMRLPDISSAPWELPPTLLPNVAMAVRATVEKLPVHELLHRLVADRDAVLLAKIMLVLVVLKGWLGWLHTATLLALGVVAAFVGAPIIESLQLDQ